MSLRLRLLSFHYGGMLTSPLAQAWYERRKEILHANFANMEAATIFGLTIGAIFSPIWPVVWFNSLTYNPKRRP